jgi:integrase
MPVIVKLPSGNWRAQIRRKGKYIGNTFRRRTDADAWALEIERTIDKDLHPKKSSRASSKLLAKSSRGKGRVFPHHHKSAGTAFQRACKYLKIDDLHFYDLRHEATSRLFEAGLTIEKVALVTGHRDWKMLHRYTSLRPESLHPRKTTKGFAKPPITPESRGVISEHAKASWWRSNGIRTLHANSRDVQLLIWMF